MNSDIVFIRTNNPDEAGLRIINPAGATLSLVGPALDSSIVAKNEQPHVFHRIEVAKWDKDGRCLHGLPISDAEEILEALAYHLGYSLTPKL